MKQGGIASPPPLTAGRLVLGNQKDTVSISKVNTFPRSERVKTAPCSIDIFKDSIPAVLSKNPAVLFEKSVHVPGVQIYSFTSRKTIHLRFVRALRESKKRAVPGISGAARLVSRLDSQGCGSQRPTLRRRPRCPTSRAGRCCRGCAGSSCESPRARTRTGRACRPPRRPRHRSRTAGR